MTAEQEKQFQTAKLNDHRAVYTGAVMSASMRDRRNLIAIIDDLQKQHPKRYTEEEIMAWAKESWMSDAYFQAYLQGALEFSRFLGMIKTEGE